MAGGLCLSEKKQFENPENVTNLNDQRLILEGKERMCETEEQSQRAPEVEYRSMVYLLCVVKQPRKKIRTCENKGH